MATSPPESMHALDVEALCQPDIDFWTAWFGDEAVGCAALRRLTPDHAEIKSMHTVATARGRGVGSALVSHLLAEATARGYRRLSLETGSMAEFAPARALYARHGFTESGPFADYPPDDPLSTFMGRDLDAGALRTDFQHVALGDVESTNDEARLRIGDRAPGPFAVTAERQLKGRGRRGRDWISPRGNLYASFCLFPERPISELPELSFVAALAVCDMARTFAALHGHVRCKWPNDVLYDGAKLSGILLESASRADNAGHAVILGIGVNIGSAPVDTPYPAAAMESFCPSISVALAYRVLQDRLSHWSDTWQCHGFAPVRQAWLERVDGLGRPVVARLTDRELHGRFAGLADDGALMLETEGGDVVRIAAGDIFRPQINMQD